MSTGDPRKEAVFCLIDKKGRGLEIGPSHNPIAPKRDGYNVQIVDHLNTAQLKKKYSNHRVNLDNIEEVDYIWNGKQTLPDLIGLNESFDWIIASHVIEHVPDLISFLQQCCQLLKSNGVLSLVIPNKNYCFDYLQSLTSTGSILEAYSEKRIRPSCGQVFNHVANAVSYRGEIAWNSMPEGELKLVHAHTDRLDLWERSIKTDEYIDVHCWNFTPNSFALIFEDLCDLGLVHFDVGRIFPTNGFEFYVSLVKTTELRKRGRMERVSQLKDYSSAWEGNLERMKMQWQNDLARLKEQSQACTNENRNLKLELAELKNRYHEVISSKSMKMTSPLRYIVGRLRTML
jgi:SAM-dependent methyltransferase